MLNIKLWLIRFIKIALTHYHFKINILYALSRLWLTPSDPKEFPRYGQYVKPISIGVVMYNWKGNGIEGCMKR